MISDIAAKRKARAAKIELLAHRLLNRASTMERLSKSDEWTDAQEERFHQKERDFEQIMREINALSNV